MADASQLPKMQSREVNADGRPLNLPGVYVHKDTGSKFITSSDFDTGVAQADALNNPLWKDGWERVGEVPTHLEVLEMRKAQEIKDAADEVIAKNKAKADLEAATEKAVKAATAVTK